MLYCIDTVPMHDHDHASHQHPPVPGRSGSGKPARGEVPISVLLTSAASRLGIVAAAIAVLWVAVFWAL